MQPAFDRTTLDRLVALGRSRGGLTPDDLRRALPVDRMSAEDIALVLIALEEDGVPVDLEEAPLRSGPALPPSATVRLPEPTTRKSAAPAPVPLPAATGVAGPETRAAAPPDDRGGGHGRVARAVAWAGVTALVLVLLVLALRAGRG